MSGRSVNFLMTLWPSLLVLRYTHAGFMALYIVKTDIPSAHTVFRLFVKIDTDVQPMAGGKAVVITMFYVRRFYDVGIIIIVVRAIDIVSISSGNISSYKIRNIAGTNHCCLLFRNSTCTSRKNTQEAPTSIRSLNL